MPIQLHNIERYRFRIVGCENAIGIMTKLKTSLPIEETWVDGATEKLSALPTATSALELDVSIDYGNFIRLSIIIISSSHFLISFHLHI